MFVKGQWENILVASRDCGGQAAVASRRRTRRGDDANRRADGAEGAQLALGSRQTLEVLRDHSKRPREPRVPLPPKFEEGPKLYWTPRRRSHERWRSTQGRTKEEGAHVPKTLRPAPTGTTRELDLI